MCDKVVNRNFNSFALFELPQRLVEQVKVKGIGVVKVVLVYVRQLLLLFIEHLHENGYGKHMPKQY